MFESYGCKVVIVEGDDISNEDELCQDIMSLLASFSGKLYGIRSANRRKKISK
jgi:predicted site-specific integrase-resolvase